MHADSDRRRIYLDNGATSWPKPEAVYRAVDRYLRDNGAPAGRSGYAEAAEASRAVEQVRQKLARLLNVGDPQRVIFAANGTDALNLALHGLLAEGDHVVTTEIEHNSVLRPLAAEQQARRVTVAHVPCDGRGMVPPEAVREAVRRRKTRLVAISHASNVTGAIQPVVEIAREAHEAGALVLCDAAQTAGHLAVDMQALGADLLATSGHKGLLGPLGTGVLAMAPNVPEQLASVRQGGTGTASEQVHQPAALPFKYESGNLNVPGIVGLGAGIDFIHERGLEQIEREGEALRRQLLAGFAAIGGLRVVGPPESEARVPLVSVVVEGYDPQEMALGLDAGYRIAVRAGLHCAPLLHRALGTLASGGTVRFSLGPFNTSDEIEQAVQAVAELVAADVSS